MADQPDDDHLILSPPPEPFRLHPGDMILINGCGREEIAMVEDVQPGPNGSTTLHTTMPVRWPADD